MVTGVQDNQQPDDLEAGEGVRERKRERYTDYTF
jgi:hypothetical protein